MTPICNFNVVPDLVTVAEPSFANVPVRTKFKLLPGSFMDALNVRFDDDETVIVAIPEFMYVPSENTSTNLPRTTGIGAVPLTIVMESAIRFRCRWH